MTRPKMRIRTLPIAALTIGLLGGRSVPAGAQSTATTSVPPVAEAPVLYDTDLPSPEFHRSRREAVMERLPENAVAIVFGAPERNRAADMNYEYRQSSDMLYLTGDPEPGSALVLVPGGVDVDGRRVREILFVPPRDPSEEVWTGRRFGTERAEARLGVELAVDNTRFADVVGPLLEGGHKVFHLPLPDGVPSDSDLERQVETFQDRVDPLEVPGDGLEGYVLQGMLVVDDPGIYDRLKALGRNLDPSTIDDPDLRAATEAFLSSPSLDAWTAKRAEVLGDRPDGQTLRAVLDELRTTKTDDEEALIQKAIDITAEAHREVMQRIEPGWKEYEAEALIEYTFRRRGSEYPAFPSIVGSGENSVILHYETNRRTMESGDVVVIDIGAEYHGYSADVTRTLPVNGTFSAEQRQIYEIVYRAQEAGIAAARAGAGFIATHQAAAAELAAGLAELGLIKGPTDADGLGRFFMHGTSHYLGLDTHDVGTYGPLEPGTVITVEPGIYIPAADDIDPKWWNIGVRIEDDVLVTDGDPVVLSAGAPRQIDEVEALMRQRPVS